MGAFIVIEGGDGSGKGTQALELVTRAMQHGYNVLHISFPNYGAPSAKFIEHYLNGKYGPARDVHPELASMLYAVDRFAVSEKIREHLRKPKSLVVADRYVASNLAHQGTKVKGKAERLKFYDRVFDIEYKTLNLPKPDLNIVLLVPSSIAQENVDKKGIDLRPVNFDLLVVDGVMQRMGTDVTPVQIEPDLRARRTGARGARRTRADPE